MPAEADGVAGGSNVSMSPGRSSVASSALPMLPTDTTVNAGALLTAGMRGCLLGTLIPQLVPEHEAVDQPGQQCLAHKRLSHK
eukprot:3939797-Rhodomonas_salina.5